MTQHNLTQILKVIRDLVMRSRPCYRDYLGTETVASAVQIGSGVFEGFESGAEAQFVATDSAFTGFILGETYTVAIDGVTADYVARNMSPISDELGPFIGTTTTFDTENGTFDGWFAASVISNDAFVFFSQTRDTSFAGKTISISQTKTETVKRYKTKLLPEYLLPTFLHKNVVASKDEVQSAQTAANNAQTTASTAQSTANNAQTMADAARTTANNAQTAANNAQTAADNAQAAADEVASNTNNPAKGIFYTANNDLYTERHSVVLYAGNTSVNGEEISGVSIRAKNPSISDRYSDLLLYVKLPSGGGDPATLHFTGGTRYGTLYSEKVELADISAIILQSSTTDSTKQFRITVDDTGTLKATEVT